MLRPTVVQVEAICAYQILVVLYGLMDRIYVRMSCMTWGNLYHKTIKSLC